MQRSGVSRVESVMNQVRERLAARTLVPGERLPSIRALAQTLGVAKSTVVEAYDRLAAEGVISARRGAGYYVCGHLPPLALAEVGPALDRSIDPLWISRQSLEAPEASLKPGCGWLPNAWLPEDDLRRALRQVARTASPGLLEYGRPFGHPGLREQLARRLADYGVAASPQQIVLTDGGTQAIDLVCRFLLEPGDRVLVDDPGYFNFQALLRAHRVTAVGVPYTPHGPDLEAMQRVLEEQRPRLYITNSAFHNPTGARLSPLVAHRLLKLAEVHDLLIIEDDIFADFEHEHAPRLSAFDGLGRVIQVGSFSKTLSASVRCGYIAARADWCEQLVDLKLATTFGNSPFNAELVHELMRKGTYRRHLDSLRGRLADAMGETLLRLRQLGLQPWLEPSGGIFVWAALPGGLDAGAVSRRALVDNVVLAPGNVFSLSQSAGAYLRFNVAQCLAPRVFEVLGRALDGAGNG
ncbi:MAG: HTH-type transcriptional regulator NorG [Pseudomonas citronellolis]|nr:MAG: HTH-type transcriptional regulator NorG [Pseudomonas citronellolis]